MFIFVYWRVQKNWLKWIRLYYWKHTFLHSKKHIFSNKTNHSHAIYTQKITFFHTFPRFLNKFTFFTACVPSDSSNLAPGVAALSTTSECTSAPSKVGVLLCRNRSKSSSTPGKRCLLVVKKTKKKSKKKDFFKFKQ